MIVWLNGPFGIGKTTTARLLVERLPGARLYDPELVGAALRTVVRRFRLVPDYQDLALWRALVPVLAEVLVLGTDGAVVMPMTVWRRDYLDQLVVRLRRVDRDLRRFHLIASEATIRRRILERPDAQGGHAWCLAHLHAGLAMAADPAFGIPVSTDGLTPSGVADAILTRLDASAPGRVRPVA